MIYNSIAELLEMVERAQDRFAVCVVDITEAQENFRPASDRWTIAENSEHVSIVSGGFLRLAHRLLKKAEADPKPPMPNLELSLQSLAEKGDLKGKWKAPETVAPKGSVKTAEAIAKNREAINGLIALKPRLEAVDMSTQTWDHPFLGALNIYQTLLVLGEHHERHRLQIEGIKGSAGFPA